MIDSGSASITSSAGWTKLLGFSEGTDPWIVLPVSFLFFFFGILFPLYFLLSFFERKLAADLQARVGPNRTIGSGLLQTFADTLKLGGKTGGIPSEATVRWFSAKNAFLYSTFAFVPLGFGFVFLDSELSAFLPLTCLGGFFLCGLFDQEGSHDIEREIIGHREAFLWLSAWVPALIATTISVSRAGSGRWTAIIASQSHSPLNWTAFSSPFGFIGFFVFLFTGLVAFQLPPFHELDRGVGRRSGEKLGIFSLNRFYLLFLWCLLATALFLGGQNVPEEAAPTYFYASVEILSTLTKASLIFIVLRVVARALPQLRQDQMSEFCWRILTPVSALCLVGELVWIGIFSGSGA